MFFGPRIRLASLSPSHHCSLGVNHKNKKKATVQNMQSGVADIMAEGGAGDALVDDELRKLLLAKQKEEALKNHVGGQAGVFLRTSLTSAVRQSAHYTCFLTLPYELPACQPDQSSTFGGST